MSGRLVGEVIDWLQTPAASELTLAERAVLMVIAERGHEKTRDAWRHRADEDNLYDRIRKAAKLSEKGLSSVLRRLRDRGLEVRVPIKEGKDGRPIFAYEGMAMRFRLPEFPASVSLPERPSGERGSEPVDNPSEGAPEASESPSTQRASRPSAPLETGPLGPRAPLGRGPYTSSTYPSTASPSSPVVLSPVAEVEGSPAEPAKKIKYRGFDFASACGFLLCATPEVQAAAEAQARRELGSDATNEDLRIRAAEIAAKGIPA